MSISFKVLLAGIVIRLVFTIILLVVVWMHSHWSVALCLTLLAVDNERLELPLPRLGPLR